MTRIVLLSDIHANLHALNAVLDHANHIGFDAIWVLGDTLGYGPQPLAVWDLVEALNPQLWLLGNHDWYIATYKHLPSDDYPRPQAQPVAVRLANGELAQLGGASKEAWDIVQIHADVYCTDEMLNRLWTLQPAYQDADQALYAAHAVYSGATWAEQLEQVCLSIEEFLPFYQREQEWHVTSHRPILHIAGHTHIQTLWRHHPTGEWAIEPISSGQWLSLQAHNFYHLNPGSVGFPRGTAVCPSWAMLDLDQNRVCFFQTPYKVELTRQKMLQLRYPQSLYGNDFLRPCPLP